MQKTRVHGAAASHLETPSGELPFCIRNIQLDERALPGSSATPKHPKRTLHGPNAVNRASNTRNQPPNSPTSNLGVLCGGW